MPDRYADAVRARRVELRARREQLTGGHRHELRSALALSRLGAADEAAALLAGLAGEVRAYVEGADAVARRRVPALVGAALDQVVPELHAAWAAAVRPAVRRIATERGAVPEPGWPRPPGPGPLRPAAAPAPVGTARAMLADVVHGAVLWRLVLPLLAVLPLAGLPAFGGPVLAPLAAATAVVVVAAAVRSRRAAVDRARLHRYTADVLAAARAALDADLARRVLELDRVAGAALDVAVARRRHDVDAELRLLAPDRVAGEPRG